MHHESTAGPPTLSVRPEHAAILREHFEAVRAGALEDLRRPDRLRDPERTRARASAAGRVLDGLGRGELALDEDAAAMLFEEAAANDEANDYARAAAEHEAFAHLTRQLCGGRS